MKLGSPVERVMELLAEFKNKIEDPDDVADISYIMGLISSDKLYTIDIRSAGGANLSSEMTAWLENNMGMKKDLDVEGTVRRLRDLLPSRRRAASSGRRRRSSPAPTRIAAKELAKLDEVVMDPAMEFFFASSRARPTCASTTGTSTSSTSPPRRRAPTSSSASTPCSMTTA